MAFLTTLRRNVLSRPKRASGTRGRPWRGLVALRQREASEPGPLLPLAGAAHEQAHGRPDAAAQHEAGAEGSGEHEWQPLSQLPRHIGFGPELVERPHELLALDLD